MVMYIPLPFFWALFSMQGSRWTLTATQLNGWTGSVKIRPDQMQIMNPFMILAFLPMFQYGVYPLIEKCGFKMTSLRRMSAGQVTTVRIFKVKMSQKQ
jgi:oligopeptide transporter 2